MCINPRLHPNGLRTPCHQCWQCKENRVNDWVGRCIAERETALGASSVTLTYGGGDCPESRFLRKSDVTSYLKAIRNDGHQVRFFSVGEYGTLKGRAHFHVLLFWNTPAPHRKLEENIHCKYWPHGFSYWKECNPASIRYAMKYIAKDFEDKAAIRAHGMSRKPMLGSAYFWQLAGKYVAAGISPQKPFYKFADVLDKYGKPVHFYMPPLVRDYFCSAFINQWRAVHGSRWWPPSEMVDAVHESSVTPEPLIYARPYRKGESPWMLPPPGMRQRFDELLNSFYAEGGGERLFWSFDEQGNRAWVKKLVIASEAEKLSRAAAFATSASCATYPET